MKMVHFDVDNSFYLHAVNTHWADACNTAPHDTELAQLLVTLAVVNVSTSACVSLMSYWCIYHIILIIISGCCVYILCMHAPACAYTGMPLAHQSYNLW